MRGNRGSRACPVNYAAAAGRESIANAVEASKTDCTKREDSRRGDAAMSTSQGERSYTMGNLTVNSDRFLENFAAGLPASASAGIATRTGAKLAGGTAFTFNGKIVGTGDIEAADFVITSDERLKSDINKIPKALDKVKELSGYTYTINEKESAGVIAQELLKVLPESVTTKDDGYYAVSYHGLIGLLIEAVKELSEKVK